MLTPLLLFSQDQCFSPEGQELYSHMLFSFEIYCRHEGKGFRLWFGRILELKMRVKCWRWILFSFICVHANSFAVGRMSVSHSGGNVTLWMTVVMDQTNLLTAVSAIFMLGLKIIIIVIVILRLINCFGVFTANWNFREICLTAALPPLSVAVHKCSVPIPTLWLNPWIYIGLDIQYFWFPL